MTPDELRTALKILPPLPRVLPLRSDVDLNPDVPLPTNLRHAAVLVPLVLRADGVKIALTLRQPHLSEHAGQVSFPGGRVDPMDVDALDTALREAREETGLLADMVEPLGFLDPYVTITGYRVAPLVAFVAPQVIWQPQVDEVAEVFEVPLEFLLDRSNLEVRAGQLPSGEPRRFYRYMFGQYNIWGATAAMLVNLVEVLGTSCAELRHEA